MLFWKIEKVGPAMKDAPFLRLVGGNAARTMIRRIPRAFHESPVVGFGGGVDLGEAVVDEGAVNFCFIEDMFQYRLAV